MTLLHGWPALECNIEYIETSPALRNELRPVRVGKKGKPGLVYGTAI